MYGLRVLVLLMSWCMVDDMCVCMCMSVVYLRGGCMFCVAFPAWVTYCTITCLEENSISLINMSLTSCTYIHEYICASRLLFLP